MTDTRQLPDLGQPMGQGIPQLTPDQSLTFGAALQMMLTQAQQAQIAGQSKFGQMSLNASDAGIKASNDALLNPSLRGYAPSTIQSAGNAAAAPYNTLAQGAGQESQTFGQRLSDLQGMIGQVQQVNQQAITQQNELRTNARSVVGQILAQGVLPPGIDPKELASLEKTAGYPKGFLQGALELGTGKRAPTYKFIQDQDTGTYYKVEVNGPGAMGTSGTVPNPASQPPSSTQNNLNSTLPQTVTQPNNAESWFKGVSTKASAVEPDQSYANDAIPQIGGRTANDVYQFALGLAFKDDKVQQTVGGLSNNTKTKSGREDVAFKRAVTNMAGAIGAASGGLPYLQALYKVNSAAAGKVVQRLALIDTVSKTVSTQFPRLAALADKVQAEGISLNEQDVSAGSTAVLRKFNNQDAANYVELLNTIRGDYAAMIRSMGGGVGGSGGQFFVQNAADAIPAGATGAVYIGSDGKSGLMGTIETSADKARQASQSEVSSLIGQFSGTSDVTPPQFQTNQSTPPITGYSYRDYLKVIGQ